MRSQQLFPLLASMLYDIITLKGEFFAPRKFMQKSQFTIPENNTILKSDACSISTNSYTPTECFFFLVGGQYTCNQICNQKTIR